MKSNFVWWLVIVYVMSGTTADLGRSKRDLARIQSIINWLLGINEERLIQTIPSLEEEQQTIYTLPAYQKLLVRTIPRTEINEGLRRVLADGVYRGDTYRPVQNSFPLVYNNYPVAMPEYRNDRAYDRYRCGMTMYPYVQEPTYEETVAFLPNTMLPCDYGSNAIVTEIKKPLPQPPIYIQNRMHEVILNHPVPTVNVQENIIMPPPNLRKVGVSEYSVVDNRLAKHKENSIVSEAQLKPTISSTIKSDRGAETLYQTYVYNTKNNGSVHTIRRHQAIYHNQRDKNNNVKIDNKQTNIGKSNHPVSTVKRQDPIPPPPFLSKEDTSAHSMVDNKLLNNKETSNKNEGLKEAITTNLPIKLVNDEQTQFKTNQNNINDRVKFAAPVHTKYKYKMIYHNQPEKNTVLEMDSMQSPTVQPKENIVHINHDAANYIYIPPVNTEMPHPGLIRVESIKKQSICGDEYTAVAADVSLNRCMDGINDVPLVSTRNNDHPTRVIVRRRKLKSRSENYRGDIPEHSSR